MGKPRQRYSKRHRQEADKIHADVVELIRRDGKVAENLDRLFRLFGDAYERGYCGPLYYRQYEDTLRIEWEASKPRVCGDTIVAYAIENGLIRPPTEEDKKKAGTINGDGTTYWWTQFDRARDLWDAWAYAWHKLKYRHRRHRRYPKDPIPPRNRSEPYEASSFGPRRVWED
jgi:hypothetical protein